MMANQLYAEFYTQLQQGIFKWLNNSDSSGFNELEQEKVVIGSVLGRRPENQDRVLFFRVRFKDSREPAFAGVVICDGMGGMVNGGDCANLAISTFVASLTDRNASALIEKLRIAVVNADKEVYREYKGRGGSTLSAIICNEKNEWAGINVGDSRIYQVLDNDTVEQLSIDDTLENQLADLNLPSPPSEFRQLLQYVGMGEGIEPRLIELKLTSENPLKWIVITSDGVHNPAKDIFQSVLVYSETHTDIVNRLLDLSEWLGGKDNATIAVLPPNSDLLLPKEELNSMEIWGVSEKVNFLTIRSAENEVSPSSNPNILDKENVKKEEISQSKKPSRSKNQKQSSKTGKKDSKNSQEKDVPQLKIEFSEGVDF